MADLSGIERSLLALNFEAVDRPPAVGGFVRNAPLLAECAGVSEEAFWQSPSSVAIEAYRKLGADVILGPILPKHPDTVTRTADGKVTGFTKPSCGEKDESPEDVVRQADVLPPLAEVRSSFDFDKHCRDHTAMVKKGQEDAGQMLFIPNTLGCAPWFRATVQFMMAGALYPEHVGRLYQHQGECARMRNEAVAKAVIEEKLCPFMWVGTDICSRDGPMFSPELLDELFFPALRRALEPLLDAGIRLIWHADGNYKLILDRFVEVGVAGFQGFYESEGGMDLRELAQMRTKSGGKLILIGSVSTTAALPLGTPDDVRREVERCFSAVGRRSGFLLNSSSSIGPDVPKENIYAMFGCATSAPGISSRA